MNKLHLSPEHLRVESFPVQNLRSEEIQALPTGLPHTCPECPHTRNVVCYTTPGVC